LFSNQYRFYKDLFFSAFSIIHPENKVRDKYKTKNNKTEYNDVFLATINQRRANINSKRNFRVMASRV